MQRQRVGGDGAFQLGRGAAEVDEDFELVGALQQHPRIEPVEVEIEEFFRVGEILGQQPVPVEGAARPG